MAIEPFALRDFRVLDPGGLADSAGRARVRDEPTCTRDGRLARGRRVDATRAPRRTDDCALAASETFGTLRDGFRLR